MLGVDYHLERPALRPPAEMRVPCQGAAGAGASDESRIAGPPALGKVQPLVLAEGAMCVRGSRSIEELHDANQVFLSHAALDLYCGHEQRVPAGPR